MIEFRKPNAVVYVVLRVSEGWAKINCEDLLADFLEHAAISLVASENRKDKC